MAVMISCKNIHCVLTQSHPNMPCLSWDNLPDPDSNVTATESGLEELFREIRTTVGQEVQIVQAVFPNPPYVMQVFLQRVFAQSVCPPHFTNLYLH